MNELRKIQFRLESTDEGFYDSQNDQKRQEAKEHQELREGYFHVWEESIEKDPQTGDFCKKQLAIVEDLNGKLHKISYELFNFINN